MTIWKRILTAVTAGMLCVGSVPVARTALPETEIAASAETYTYGDLRYSVLDDGTIEIDHCNANLTKVEIPAEIDGMAVTSIGQLAFIDYTSPTSNLTNIIIPNSVTNIEKQAFRHCSKLTDIIIPDSVTSIGDSAFEGCSSLTSITISDSMTSIGAGAFYGCTSLTSITIPDSMTSIEYELFWGCSSLTSITIPDSVTSIGYMAFYDCENLTVYYSGTEEEWNAIEIGDPNENLLNATIHYNSIGGGVYGDLTYIIFADRTVEITDCDGSATEVEIPAEIDGMAVTSIGNYAFDYSINLTAINIPYGVTYIGNDAFRMCRNLTDINIPNSVISIKNFAFLGCESLTTITIPGSVTSIEYRAFYNCENLTDVYYSGAEEEWNAIEIDDSNENLLNATIHNNSIGGGVYGDLTYIIFVDGTVGITDCDSSVTAVEIPAEIDGMAVTSIENYAFDSCENLTAITIPDSVTSIGDFAFNDCYSLIKITIPDNVTRIGNETFASCISLTEITIPDSVTSIGDLAFAYCYDLTEITIPDGVTSIGMSAFYYCKSLTEIIIPDSVTDIGRLAFGVCTNLTDITVLEGNLKYASQDGVLFNQDRTAILQYPTGKTDSKYTIPDSVTSIGMDAFDSCESLTEIIIPDSVTSIGFSAFNSCENLTDITIPDSVIHIEDYAFYDCQSLTAITIPDSVTSIAGSTFKYCNGLTKITIPDNVTSIGYSAFACCESLTEITIPGSVTSIGSWAFDECSSLTDIYYNGTKEEWNAIEIGSSNEEFLNATIHFSNVNETTTTETSTTTTTSAEILYGDINLDGRIDITDAVLLNKAAAGAVKLSDQAFANADCDADGEPGANNDAIVLLKFLMHLVNTLPYTD